LGYREPIAWLEDHQNELAHGKDGTYSRDQVIAYINEGFVNSQEGSLIRKGIMESAISTESLRAEFPSLGGRAIARLREAEMRGNIEIPQAEAQRQKIISELKVKRTFSFTRRGRVYSQERDTKGHFQGKMNRI
jgi:hypothetical protein